MFRVATSCLMHILVAVPPATAACDDPRLQRYEPRTFLGYACADGCERHKAGFRWAEQHSVMDPRSCVSLPQPEAEGCIAYADDGPDAAAAGSRWAVENEIARPCQCAGAGERFQTGCVHAIESPAAPLP